MGGIGYGTEGDDSETRDLYERYELLAQVGSMQIVAETEENQLSISATSDLTGVVRYLGLTLVGSEIDEFAEKVRTAVKATGRAQYT